MPLIIKDILTDKLTYVDEEKDPIVEVNAERLKMHLAIAELAELIIGGA